MESIITIISIKIFIQGISFRISKDSIPLCNPRLCKWVKDDQIQILNLTNTFDNFDKYRIQFLVVQSPWGPDVCNPSPHRVMVKDHPSGSWLLQAWGKVGCRATVECANDKYFTIDGADAIHVGRMFTDKSAARVRKFREKRITRGAAYST